MEPMRVGLPPIVVRSRMSAQDLGERVPRSLTDYGVPEAWQVTKGLKVDGKPMRIGNVDTGVDETHYRRGDLQGRVTDLRDFTSSRFGPFDVNGHGTHTLGTMGANEGNGVGITGILPLAEYASAKCLGDQGSGSDRSIYEGVLWLVDECSVDWINMSLRSDVPSPLIARAVAYATSKNVGVVVAAGNSGGKVGWPAADEHTICVVSVNEDRELSWFSCRGPEVDVAAPGEKILSCYLNGGYAELDGTSMACPHVTACLAMADASGVLRSRRAESIRSQLDAWSDDAGAPGKDSEYGYGMINLKKALPEAKVPPRDRRSFSFLGMRVNIPAAEGDTVGLSRSR